MGTSPSVGKNTLARLSAKAFDREFITIPAVLSGVKEIREAIEQAQQNNNQYGKQTILFADEIDHFNKSQQDALLPNVNCLAYLRLSAPPQKIPPLK